MRTNKKPAFLFFALIFVTFSTRANPVSIFSPDKNIQVEVGIGQNGIPFYTVSYADSLVIKKSSLGLNTNFADLTQHLQIKSVTKVESISDDYTLKSGKRLHYFYHANEREIIFNKKNGVLLSIVFQVSNHGVAFRYKLKNNTSETLKIYYENTSFHFPDAARGWLSPETKARSIWHQAQPSYEQHYKMDVPVNTPSAYGEGWVFPALFRSADHWVLITESDMRRDYCAAHLSNALNGSFNIAFPQDAERTRLQAPLYPQNKYTVVSPWRVLIIGRSLAPIVESTLVTDLSAPSKIKDASFVEPGVASWSWIMYKTDSTIYRVQKRYIDFASEMHWKYCTIDASWDKQIGYKKIKELADYARTKHVGLFLWYNSNGHWNTTPPTPNHILFDPVTRRQEFAKLKEMGIRGIKIDFFGGDGQSFMNYYQNLLVDAASFGLMVDFHGTTVPRGWSRTYPNLLSMEAVRGYEFITFNQKDADLEPSHCSMLPFTRNVVGAMDFTGSNFSGLPNTRRITTKGFELALSVLFQSGIKHIAETPEGMAEQPEYVIQFMKNLPVKWDDIKFITGYPGKYVVIARKSGEKWYIAGINGESSDRSVSLHLSDIGNFQGGTLITDGNGSGQFVRKEIKKSKVQLDLKPYGGFVLVFKSE